MLNRDVKKVESRAPLTQTWKKMSTLTSFQSFCAFVQFFAFENKLRNFQNGFCSGHFCYTLIFFHLSSFDSMLQFVIIIIYNELDHKHGKPKSSNLQHVSHDQT
jgi:hypothetical protein